MKVTKTIQCNKKPQYQYTHSGSLVQQRVARKGQKADQKSGRRDRIDPAVCFSTLYRTPSLRS
jgi:hypothetical protein